MKELSIEEKARAYDKAFRIAQELYNDHNSSNVGKGYVCTVFPELAKSEDEKIRKWIIGVLSTYEHDKNLRDAAIAWLEKQGEQKPITIDIDKMVSKYSHTKDGDFGLPVNCQIRAYRQGINDALNLSLGIKKQGEQKPFDYENANIQQNDFAPMDEPKFKVGDWVMFKNKHQSIYQVEKIEDGYYILRHTHGGTFRVCVLHDESLRLWTIQDAKPGDVLVNWNNTIYLFKGIDDGEVVKFYCFYNTNYEEFKTPFNDDSHLGLTEPQFEHHPAIKEQRNLLFTKMKEAGYEWDVEKKELKKIENEIEIPFGAKDSELQEATYYIPKGFYSVLDGNKVIIKRFKNPRPQNN